MVRELPPPGDGGRYSSELMRDAYQRFFVASNTIPADFFEFGLNEIIHVPLTKLPPNRLG